MAGLYQELAPANTAERQAIAGNVFDSMRGGVELTANMAYFDLCQSVIATQGEQESGSISRGVFTALASAALLLSGERVSGFVDAVGRTPQADVIIDAGTGSSGLLAIAAAVYHPRAEIFAYEINPKAAECAQAIAKLFGFDENRLHILAADVMTSKLPIADLATTETFGPGFSGEMGAKIAQILRLSAAEILPAEVVLHATDDDNNSWQEADTFDLAEDNEWVTTHLTSTGAGQRDIRTYASYYDARGAGILTRHGSDDLTMAKNIGPIHVPKAGTRIRVHYRSGPSEPTDPPRLQIEQ